ncbi:MAG TPA: hypothetical protein VMS08_01665 [Candidatus Saccharimonadia bacterium]|nr:hypothetical protein [Candidatus Saccharimonadia bacterium]
MMPGRTISTFWRNLDGPKRVLIIATALLAVPLFGELVSLRDLTTVGHDQALALLIMALSIFTVPTCVILVSVIATTFRSTWRTHVGLLLVCLLDLLLVAMIFWYFVDPCGWMNVFGLVARECR